jgi:FlaA1/EpsC-like NDP-sugar epimerase
MWSKAGVDELQVLCNTALQLGVTHVFIIMILKSLNLFPFNSLPLSLPFLDSFFFVLFATLIRISIRFMERIDETRHVGNDRKPALIIGAGYAGIHLAQTMQRLTNLEYKPVAFLDDDINKQNMIIRGLPVIGKIDDLERLLDKKHYGFVLFAIPSAPGKLIRKVSDTCQEKNVKVLTMPSVSEIIDGKISIAKMREIRIEDLLRREPVKIDSQNVKEFLKDKRVLVTGGGGSIGSELCRQILTYNPSNLLILGHGENSVFEIEQELKYDYCGNGNNTTRIVPVIADLRMKDRLYEIYEEYFPEVVFHASAHKHVPLMESNPCEAITNNIIGTQNLVDICIEYDIQRFIGISTDKAVNPTSIMGASKRVTEMIILDAARRTRKYYSTVRFGNVLGSRGSVVRTFKNQIKNRQPITVTHPDMTRYFMTIPEAVTLVLQASILGSGGDVFVLDMGDPVRILDLARDMIKLSGLQEGDDIDIKFSGLRPGEKLFEELNLENEDFERTAHSKIMIAKNAGDFVNGELKYLIESFKYPISPLDKNEILHKLQEVVPEFQHEDLMDLTFRMPKNV